MTTSAWIESGKIFKNFKKIEKFIFLLQLAIFTIYTRRVTLCPKQKRFEVREPERLGWFKALLPENRGMEGGHTQSTEVVGS